MKIKDLVAKIAKKEGKKKGVNIAQLSEVVAIISDLAVKDPEVIACLWVNGKRRARRKK